MILLFSVKATRMLLVFSVSIWMAGGCLFGCALGAKPELEAQTVVAEESCHVARAHDCCGQKQKSPMPGNEAKRTAGQQKNGPALGLAYRDLMKDCPLAVNATAVTSKNSGHVPEPARGPVSALPLVEKNSEISNTSLVANYLPNRGPTHLHCCVFRI